MIFVISYLKRIYDEVEDLRRLMRRLRSVGCAVLTEIGHERTKVIYGVLSDIQVTN